MIPNSILKTLRTELTDKLLFRCQIGHWVEHMWSVSEYHIFVLKYHLLLEMELTLKPQCKGVVVVREFPTL